MKALCLLLDRMSKSAQQIRFCTSHDGTRIAYATCGQGPPLVWAPHSIHHLRFDWDSPIWCPWLTLLTRHHSLIYYDWRGCGLSDREGVEFTPDRYVEDFEAIIEATNVDRFALVAMGQGTRMAMTYAVRHPERIRRFVLLGPSSCRRVVRGQNQEQAEEEETRLRAVELGWHDDNPAYGRFFTSMHLPDASADQIRAYDDLLRQTTSPANAIAMMRSFHRADVRDFVPNPLSDPCAAFTWRLYHSIRVGPYGCGTDTGSTVGPARQPQRLRPGHRASMAATCWGDHRVCGVARFLRGERLVAG